MCSEKEIFDDLSKLCISEGFIHIVAYFCFRDNMIFQKTESLTPHDIEGHLLKQPLIRTEISTLLGLMVKGKIELKLPSPDNMSNMITSSEKFLEKIHKSMLKDCNLEHLIRKTPEKNSSNPFADAKILRETIFYARDSAYLFQYYDFAVERYSRNDTWLLANKGYLIHDVRNVISCIEEIQKNKMHLALQDLKNIPREQWTVLPGFEFTISEIEQRANINANTIRKILDAFTIPKESNNQTFLSVSDYNISNSHPLIKVTEDRYILFQIYSLAEAFYESPIFWFREDNSYKDEANKNNGIFTEEFTRKRLKLVFGCQNVFSNITIYKGSKSVGEIDVLVVFADRVVIVQAKSKRLTIGARKGNDNCIQGDFQKAIQDAYDQGVLCAKLLEDDNYDLYDSSLQKLEINRSFKEVYIVCIVSDHYPALNFQSRQFLKYTQTDKIFAPFVMDVFNLDVITEMLQTPLYFLSYINRRVMYADRIMSNHEMVILAYHLKMNLWLGNDTDFSHLDDSISIDLDIAMMARRSGIEGKKTPDGILTKFQTTLIGSIISQIEKVENHGVLDLGFMLLSLNEDAIHKFNDGITKIVNLSRKDNKCHDVSMEIDNGKSGITIHCNHDESALAYKRLRNHCEVRNGINKTDEWFGLCIDSNVHWRLALGTKSKRKAPGGRKGVNNQYRKVGRNAQCPCKSGLKYKKCCLT